MDVCLTLTTEQAGTIVDALRIAGVAMSGEFANNYNTVRRVVSRQVLEQMAASDMPLRANAFYGEREG
jgi:hypothetical protein